METTNISIRRFLVKFGQEYDFLYENRNCVAGFREAVDAFDAFCESEGNAAFVREFCAYRGDFISSDREAAAFMFALSSLTGAESVEAPAPKKPLKTHKIRGVEKSVCTAEQRIAYNVAFYQGHINGLSLERVLAFWRDDPEGASFIKSAGRYDTEAVEAALKSGFDRYIAKPFIASSHDQIGAAFPLPEE